MKRLRELRESKRISQQKLAMDLALSQASISKYEKNLAEPEINTIIKLSQYFNVSSDYLLGISDIKTQYMITDLSENELELLRDYRMLGSVQKQKAQAYIKGLSES